MELHIYEYALPLKVPFKISGMEVKKRVGLIFEFIDDTGVYYSEAAPLQGFSDETLKELKSFLNGRLYLKKKIRQSTICCMDDDLPPSLRFAISSLWFQHQARKSDKSMATYFDANHAKQVRINAAMGLGSPDEILPRVEKIVDEGYDTLKLKVGKSQPLEIEVVEEIRTRFPNLKIRLDANQAWTPQQALENLTEFEPYDIEYCEQPVSKDSIEGLAWLKQKTHVKIAADESVRTYEDAQTLIKYKLVDLMILKPMFIGSVEAFQSICKAARLSGMDVVVTTALESGIGRRIVASLASTILYSPYAHGLSTGQFFTDDILPDDNRISKGVYDTTGLEKDFATLDKNKLTHILTL